MPTKDEIIAEASYADAGFGSVPSLLRDAKEKDPTIAKKDVAEWKLKNLDRTKKLKGFNSHVAPEAGCEFQVDLFYHKTDQEPTWYQPPYGLLVVDSFSKYCYVLPIGRKLATRWAKAFHKIFEVMGKPKVIYTDPDSPVMATSVEKFFKTEGVDWIRTREHAAIAERTIRTIKSELDKRMACRPEKWTKVLPSVLDKHTNKEIHSATGMTPTEAREEHNDHAVRASLVVHSVKNRVYPELRLGDRVRVYRKRKTFDKERVPVWEDGYRKIMGIIESHGQKLYKVDDLPYPFIRRYILLLPSS
jgi:hypothetical protein